MRVGFSTVEACLTNDHPSIYVHAHIHSRFWMIASNEGSRWSPESPRVSTLLGELIPGGVRVVEFSGRCGFMSRINTAEHQYRQHVAGRQCAQDAIAHFGISNPPMPKSRGGRPSWPPSLVGSITHAGEYAAAAVGECSRFRAIGIDAEIVGEVSSDLWSSVFLPEEIEWIRGLPHPDQGRAATLMFSGKETFYKCQYEITGQWLEFKDVGIEVIGWNDGGKNFQIHPVRHIDLLKFEVRPLLGYFAFIDQLVLTVMVMGLADES